MAENVSRRSVFKGSAGAAVFASSASVTPLSATPAAAAGATQAASVPEARRAAPARQARHDAATELRVQKLLDRMTVEEKFGQLQQLTWTPTPAPARDRTSKAREAAGGGPARLGAQHHRSRGVQRTPALRRRGVPARASRWSSGSTSSTASGPRSPSRWPRPRASTPASSTKDAEVSAREAGVLGRALDLRADGRRQPRAALGAHRRGQRRRPVSDRASWPRPRCAATRARTTAPKAGSPPAPSTSSATAFPEGGRDYNTVDISERRLRDIYLPPFKAAVDAGVATVMAAFNTVNGVPAHANRAHAHRHPPRRAGTSTASSSATTTACRS